MKVITTTKVRKLLKKQWPQLKHIWIFDRKLVLLPDKQFQEILNGLEIYKNHFKDQLFDCDDFALIANAFVKLKIAELKLPYNWVFGEAAMIHPEIGIHNQNIFITEDYKIKLFEPQVNKIIIPNKENVFYVRI